MRKTTRNHKQAWRGPLLVLTAVLCCLAIAILATIWATRHTQPKPQSKPETVKIVFPAKFMKGFLEEGQTTEQYVRKYRDNVVPEWYTDFYATKDGNEVIVVTHKQLQTRIKDNEQDAKDTVNRFLALDPAYRCEIDPDGREMTIWADKNLSSAGFGDLMLNIPQNYGLNHYLKGGHGDWDMHITIRNCHTNQLITSFYNSQGFSYDQQTFWN
ncbi:hypothetical protein OZX74_00910 [Bifidobacterium sp. ESL0798]|uniref:hypothetical protein n=1 Tax=Bifidobacterium sp. ESL0798 TaxID=2983235 RepID=UPI0023F89678|nr:hypothetical protein [Bifidobacterium sp. ESL0798]WEV74159.1 hypothetical protein OZX74_00910 [Bifidobacterium sp. ESL0798]